MTTTLDLEEMKRRLREYSSVYCRDAADVIEQQAERIKDLEAQNSVMKDAIGDVMPFDEEREEAFKRFCEWSGKYHDQKRRIQELEQHNEHLLKFINEFGEVFGQTSAIQTVKYDYDKADQDRNEAWSENNRLREVIASLHLELEEAREALSYAVKEADGWHDECRGGPIQDNPEMDAARRLSSRRQKAEGTSGENKITFSNPSYQDWLMKRGQRKD